MTDPITRSVDIAICGAGPVGLTLAALLMQRGVSPDRLLLLDAKTAEQSAADPRSIALSFGSRQILERVGAWPIPAQAITQIHVSRRGHFGRTLIEAEQYHVPALGYVTRYGALITALNRVVANAGLNVLRPVQISRSDEYPDQIDLYLNDGTHVKSSLLIQVEGGVFAQQPARERHRDYGQTAIVTHVRVSAPLMERAFERFTAEGPLALLPQDDGYAVVWCAATATAAQLMQCDDTAFLQALSNAFGQRVGQFLDVAARFSYPLGLNAEVAPTARTMAIGNAAQTLHPVAGQGLNLGLRDASVLAQCLSVKARPAALVDFAQQRKVDRRVAIGLTDTMARIFASAPDGALSQTLLGLSLGLVDALPPLRRLLAEQMMYGQRH
jgi:2-octaprenyl-6-methoxyphenol hydroxylase